MAARIGSGWYDKYMQFLRESQGEAVQAIAAKICDELIAGQRVLWLVCGGSNIAAEVEVMKLVSERAGERLAALAILPTDERYGPAGHKDSNAEQLHEAGFEPGEATWVDVLMHDVPLDQTVRFYNDVAATALSSATSIIAQFGIGPDGHIAGILPDSPAAKANGVTAVGYETPEFTRITLVPAALQQVHTAYALAYGESKKTALTRLQKNKETLAKLPSRLLYKIPEVYIYNDQIESED